MARVAWTVVLVAAALTGAGYMSFSMSPASKDLPQLEPVVSQHTFSVEALIRNLDVMELPSKVLLAIHAHLPSTSTDLLTMDEIDGILGQSNVPQSFRAPILQHLRSHLGLGPALQHPLAEQARSGPT